MNISGRPQVPDTLNQVSWFPVAQYSRFLKVIYHVWATWPWQPSQWAGTIWIMFPVARICMVFYLIFAWWPSWIWIKFHSPHHRRLGNNLGFLIKESKQRVQILIKSASWQIQTVLMFNLFFYQWKLFSHVFNYLRCGVYANTPSCCYPDLDSEARVYINTLPHCCLDSFRSYTY